MAAIGKHKNGERMSSALQRINMTTDGSLTGWKRVLGKPVQEKIVRDGANQMLAVVWVKTTLGFFQAARVVAVFGTDGHFKGISAWTGLATPPPVELNPAGVEGT